MNRTYFSLKDFLKAVKPLAGDYDTNGAQFGAYSIPDFLPSALMQTFNAGFTDTYSTQLATPEVKRLWCDYIIPSYWNTYICYVDDYDELVDTNQDIYYNIFARICAWMGQSSIEKIILINLYENQSSNLLSQLAQSSTTTNRVNDTPQEGGDYTDDDHTSNYQQTTSSVATDSGTLVARLDEIKRLYSNLFIEWAEEFYNQFAIYA